MRFQICNKVVNFQREFTGKGSLMIIITEIRQFYSTQSSLHSGSSKDVGLSEGGG